MEKEFYYQLQNSTIFLERYKKDNTLYDKYINQIKFNYYRDQISFHTKEAVERLVYENFQKVF